ncbi:hypothetical protein GGX14DRAFT_390429 [Mycena pura]|uniref:Uncharacterized protein n=1 Tax=Mycena pura TaxID=153505 RepID=A0AAD6VT22_9AGAR|nr:hypothetical protein GGX14DRAFT_390429 [Mycena pura]
MQVLAVRSREAGEGGSFVVTAETATGGGGEADHSSEAAQQRGGGAGAGSKKARAGDVHRHDAAARAEAGRTESTVGGWHSERGGRNTASALPQRLVISRNPNQTPALTNRLQQTEFSYQSVVLADIPNQVGRSGVGGHGQAGLDVFAEQRECLSRCERLRLDVFKNSEERL